MALLVNRERPEIRDSETHSPSSATGCSSTPMRTQDAFWVACKRHLRDCARGVGIQAGGGTEGDLCLLSVNSERLTQRKEWLPNLPAKRAPKTETCHLERTESSPVTNLLDSAIHLPFFKRPESVAHFTGRQPSTLLRSDVKVMESVSISGDSISAHYGLSTSLQTLQPSFCRFACLPWCKECRQCQGRTLAGR